jgi:hypothetical protein
MIVCPHKHHAYSDPLDSYDFQIGSKPTEFVTSFLYLGHLAISSSDDDDIIKRHSEFIGQIKKALRYFRKLDSFTRCNQFRSHCTSF